MTTQLRRPFVALLALVGALALLMPAFTGSAGAADSSVYIVHGIPGVPVDVYVGGTAPENQALADFQPGTVAGPLTIPEGPLAVVVVATGDDPTVPANQVIDQTLDVPGGANLSVVADLVGGAPVLTAFANDVSAVARGSSRVTVRHAADAPPVQVLVDGQVAISDLASGEQASAVLPAGTYTIEVQLTDGTPLPALAWQRHHPGGKNVIVYAAGSRHRRRLPARHSSSRSSTCAVTPATTPTTAATAGPPRASAPHPGLHRLTVPRLGERPPGVGARRAGRRPSRSADGDEAAHQLVAGDERRRRRRRPRCRCRRGRRPASRPAGRAPGRGCGS